MGSFTPEDLEKLGCSRRVIAHCLAVMDKALEIARQVNIPVDTEMVKEAALLHDIGRCRTHGVDHGVAGAEIAKKLGAREEVVRAVERHIGAGITREEAVKMGLPDKDYIPESPEEKIVAYADNLTLGRRHLTFRESLEKFREILGRNHPAIKRYIALHQEIQGWISKS